MNLDDIIEQNQKKIDGRKLDIEEMRSNFSTTTIENIIEESKRELSENSEDSIQKIVSTALEAGLKTKFTGSEIKVIIDRARAETLKKSILSLSEKIIDDALLAEEERSLYRVFDFEELLIAGMIAHNIRIENEEEVSKQISRIMPEDSKVGTVSTKLEEKVREVFYNDNSASSGLVFYDLLYNSVYPNQEAQRAAVHVPIFESMIFYT